MTNPVYTVTQAHTYSRVRKLKLIQFNFQPPAYIPATYDLIYLYLIYIKNMQAPAYGAAYNAQAGGISMQVPMQAPRWEFESVHICLSDCWSTKRTADLKDDIIKITFIVMARELYNNRHHQGAVRQGPSDDCVHQLSNHRHHHYHHRSKYISLQHSIPATPSEK